MKCPRCQDENPAGVRFCGACGALLELLCPACGASNPPANRFCHQCGGPLGGGSPAPKFVSPEAYTPKQQEHLTTATAIYREMDMRFWLEQAEAESRALA